MKADMARLKGGDSFGYGSVNKIFKTDLYMQKYNQSSSQNKILYVPFTSDKGLCGGINSGIVRDVKAIFKDNPNRSQCGLYVVGDKGSVALSRPFADVLKKGVHELATPMNYSTAAAIAHDISVVGEDYDKIILIYNKYKSAISTEITHTELMTRHRFLDVMSYGKKYNQKPDKKTSNPAIYDLYLASNFYHAMLNNLASEQSARMNAMENASKNAKEIVQKLVLEYNKARQARITMELVEIISGASAV
eukprot:CAMPEP_0170513606 /NCGR_PEP_ID=MMETSP0209-20121228/126_1 /TAXON_ID=665100 ORGANISM="Litonotus pictus, Strain P1" /NCGR_SAMPLE_ID=MMETSP0209 /ASSEMBLY_ACC=CAM_ASM_000301 /LENGTH=248 /DNA_ID=CAMNT_0010797359 /DNA_START=152 /DNA_END=898 /DNA_ORIENTATION=+